VWRNGASRRERRKATDGGLAVGVYAAAVSLVVLGGLGALAAAFDQPYLFPSVGPTVMVLAERPRSASAHPRNVIVGHVIGLAAGLLCLLVFGLRHAPPVLHHRPSAARVAAVVVSLALTTLLLQLLRAPHAPAGATTLIVSLGLLKSVHDLVAIGTAIVFVAVVATVLNVATRRRRSLRVDNPRDSLLTNAMRDVTVGREESVEVRPAQRVWPGDRE